MREIFGMKKGSRNYSIILPEEHVDVYFSR